MSGLMPTRHICCQASYCHAARIAAANAANRSGFAVSHSRSSARASPPPPEPRAGGRRGDVFGEFRGPEGDPALGRAGQRAGGIGMAVPDAAMHEHDRMRAGKARSGRAVRTADAAETAGRRRARKRRTANSARCRGCVTSAMRAERSSPSACRSRAPAHRSASPRSVVEPTKRRNRRSARASP